MKIDKFVKEKKLGLSLLLLFFTLLIFSLFLRSIFLGGLYPYSIFFIILVFIFSQYFDFGYKLLISFSLVLMLFCIFFVLINNYPLAESFGTYVYAFLVLGILGYFLDNLKEKLKTKGLSRLYRISFLYILIPILLLSIVIFIKDFRNDAYYTVFTKNAIVKSSEFIKDKYLRTFNKEIYYGKKDFVIIDGVKIEENIIIHIDSPKKDGYIPGKVIFKGWAIEKNSIYDSGIDRIEFFLGGKPGEGKYLGVFSQEYNPELETINYIENLYSNFYNRKPFSSELDFWAINLEYNIMSYYDIAGNIINKLNFMDRSLSNEDFTSALYNGLLNRDWDGSWVDKLEADLTREGLLYIIINSEEFHKRSENYYESISIKENDLDIIRRDVGEKYGKQFYLSSFGFWFDSTKFSNGKHEVYIYAHSPIFGWDYTKLKIQIEN